MKSNTKTAYFLIKSNSLCRWNTSNWSTFQNLNVSPMSQPSVIVFGSINMDLVAKTPKLPTPGETLLGRSFSTVPGGKEPTRPLPFPVLAFQLK